MGEILTPEGFGGEVTTLPADGAAVTAPDTTVAAVSRPYTRLTVAAILALDACCAARTLSRTSCFKPAATGGAA